MLLGAPVMLLLLGREGVSLLVSCPNVVKEIEEIKNNKISSKESCFFIKPLKIYQALFF
jgi:hypothetical protein